MRHKRIRILFFFKLDIMVQYVCPRCEYQTTAPSHYKYHIQRKNPCRCTTGSDVSTEELLRTFQERIEGRSVTCEGCGTTFGSRTAKCRHRKGCEAYAEQQRTQATSTINTTNTTTTNTNNNTGNGNSVAAGSMDHANINNTTTNISVDTLVVPRAFGDEDLAHLALSNPDAARFLIKVLRDRADGLMDLVSKVHFDKEYPQNHNLRKRDRNDAFVEIYDGEEWQLRIAENVANVVFDKMNDLISAFVDANSADSRDSIREKWMFDPYRLWHAMQHTRGFAHCLTKDEIALRDGPCPERTVYSDEDLNEVVRRVNRGKLYDYVYRQFQDEVAKPLGWEYQAHSSVDGGQTPKERSMARVIYDYFAKLVYEKSSRR